MLCIIMQRASHVSFSRLHFIRYGNCIERADDDTETNPMSLENVARGAVWEK